MPLIRSGHHDREVEVGRAVDIHWLDGTSLKRVEAWLRDHHCSDRSSYREQIHPVTLAGSLVVNASVWLKAVRHYSSDFLGEIAELAARLLGIKPPPVNIDPPHIWPGVETGNFDTIRWHDEGLYWAKSTLPYLDAPLGFNLQQQQASLPLATT